MLYKKNTQSQIDDELFRNPTSEYRGAPFWAWNDKLEPDELIRQIGVLKEMGFGGFHMHTRSGMTTPYLSKEFLSLIKLCTDKAKKEKMLAWLYDEDRWPSGAAGGIVTKDPAFREKKILFTVNRDQEADSRRSAYYFDDISFSTDSLIAEKAWVDEGRKYLLASFTVKLNKDGTLNSYSFSKPEMADWFAYVDTDRPSGWFNGQTYVDTMSEKAISKFIDVTYGSYAGTIGDELGKTVPAIFTDEPQFVRKSVLPFANSRSDVVLPWTTDFPNTFFDDFGFDIVMRLPELIWDLPDGRPSRARYLYHEHACQRFTDAFAKQCGTWCENHGFYLTGHMMEEHSLHSQTSAIGEAMRAYRYFGLPGVDVLCDNYEPTTVKQCASAVHQWGKEGMTSELYGVTGWAFDFRGHKYQGDWQAAMGVTVRVPHLSWYSMRGSAKRDYPASINYQSSWYRDYSYIEDHYARLNTALTRGRPDIRVAVVHPVESYWLMFGPAENTSATRKTLDSCFTEIINILLENSIDFDFISESQLPLLEKESADATLFVGNMRYEAVIIPDTVTIRKTTADSLIRFSDRGGNLISTGRFPRFIDAEEDSYGLLKKLKERCVFVPFTSSEIVGVLERHRNARIIYDSGYPCNSLFVSKRNDSDCDWFFITHVSRMSKYDHEKTIIELHGIYRLTEYDTLTGNITPKSEVEYDLENRITKVKWECNQSDSLLLRAFPIDCDVFFKNIKSSKKHKADRFLGNKQYATEEQEDSVGIVNHAETITYEYLDCVPFTTDEPNVVVLDMPEWSLDGEHYEERLEMLRIDEKLRGKFGYPAADGHDVQPWCIEEEKIDVFPYLRFTVESEIESECLLAYEGAEKVILNGKDVPVEEIGWFTDRAIKTMRLSMLKAGINTLIIRAPFGKRVSLENYFLLGRFGVKVAGAKYKIQQIDDKICFGDITRQGLPFYGGKLTYHCPISLLSAGDVSVHIKRYSGAVIEVSIDGKEQGIIAFEPCTLKLENISAGNHIIGLTICLTRVNCFTALHNSSGHRWIGPSYWYRRDDGWSNEYILYENGILCSPVFTIKYI